MSETNKLIEQLCKDNPDLAELVRGITPTTPPMMRFPKGLRWHFYNTGKTPRFRKQYMCYSLVPNLNGKFISWIYDWREHHAKFISVVEHCRRKDAKRRAHKLYEQRINQIREAQEESNFNKSAHADIVKDVHEGLV